MRGYDLKARSTTDTDAARALLRKVMEKPTCGIEDAARVLGVGRSTAYAAVHDGSLPALQLGGRLVMPTARLLEMLGLNPELLLSQNQPAKTLGETSMKHAFRIRPDALTALPAYDHAGVAEAGGEDQ